MQTLAWAADIAWWQKAVVYQVYPRSLKDSNGDGTGDLQGITSKLDYLASLGVSIVWISPIFKSPMVDFGYDIQDFRDIDPIFGTMADFDVLLSEAHSRGLKVVLDFVPNHSSDLHEWFQKATNPSDPDYLKYKNYYVWVDSKVPGEQVPPNNWGSAWSNTAWKWNDANQQFYLHQFHEKQPDLNYRNREVVEEMKNVLRFWLDKGVDGFRMDAVVTMVEKEGFPDFDPNNPDNPLINQPETYQIIQEFRAVLDTYTDKVMMTEAWGTQDQILDYYGTPENPGAHFSFNFVMINNLNSGSSAQDFTNVVSSWLSATSQRGVWSNWVMGNHDQHRAGSRYNADLIDGLNMLVLLLPGTAVTYYGEEIGMVDNYDISCDQAHDPQGCQDNVTLGNSRDPQRTPFQWDTSTNAGFSTGTPWLPINANYLEVNAEVETSATKSHLSIYKKLVGLRGMDVIQIGTININAMGNVFTFSRDLEGSESIIVAVNLGADPTPVNFASAYPLEGKHLMVLAQSLNSNLDEMAHLNTSLWLGGHTGVVFETMNDM